MSATYRRGHFPDAPPPLGPTDAPRLRPPPAAMSRGSWRRLERAAARRGRRSGAEGRAPVSGAGGAVRGARRAEGRGGARPAVGGAAAGASRSRAPRRGGGVWCGEVGVPSAPVPEPVSRLRGAQVDSFRVCLALFAVGVRVS